MDQQKMKQIPIGEATTEQLREFAASSLGITIPGNAKPETVLAKVQAAWDKPNIVLPEDDGAGEGIQAGTPPRPVTAAQQPPGRKMVRIQVQRTEEAGGSEPVPVSVNGKAMLIPRGKPVDVPEEYVHALENAVKHVYDDSEDGKGINPVAREVLMYPFQRVA